MHFAKLVTAFALGIGATAGIVQIVKRLPLHDYVKNILCVVVPIPSIAVVLVLLYYGPESVSSPAVEPVTSGDMVRMSLFGALAGLSSTGIIATMRLAGANRKEGEQHFTWKE